MLLEVVVTQSDIDVSKALCTQHGYYNCDSFNNPYTMALKRALGFSDVGALTSGELQIRGRDDTDLPRFIRNKLYRIAYQCRYVGDWSKHDIVPETFYIHRCELTQVFPHANY